MGGLDKGLVELEPRAVRQTSVLVARIAVCRKPGDTDGEKADQHCLDTLSLAAEISGGRVLRRQRDTLIVVLRSADAAAAAAARMQAHANCPTERSSAFAVRIGFATGEVAQTQRDVVGEAVNRALEFSRRARYGEVLTSDATASSLSERMRAALSAAADSDGTASGTRALRWREAGAQVLAIYKDAESSGRKAVLKLHYRGNVSFWRRELEYIVLGRDARCQVVVSEKLASRRHCTVTRHNAGFMLQDHSTNGTFVGIAGEGEILVHSEACVLSKAGWISLGVSGDANADVIEYGLQ